MFYALLEGSKLYFKICVCVCVWERERDERGKNAKTVEKWSLYHAAGLSSLFKS